MEMMKQQYKYQVVFWNCDQTMPEILAIMEFSVFDNHAFKIDVMEMFWWAASHSVKRIDMTINNKNLLHGVVDQFFSKLDLIVSVKGQFYRRMNISC